MIKSHKKELHYIKKFGVSLRAIMNVERFKSMVGVRLVVFGRLLSLFWKKSVKKEKIVKVKKGNEK